MLTRLVVQDFQSLADVDIELGALTVLVGPSNRGKSAVLRAVESLAFNPPLAKGEQAYIRHGKKECLVLVEDDAGPGRAVSWLKGPSPYYAIIEDGVDDEEFTKLGRGVPEEIRDALGIRDIDIDDQFSIRPQFHTQGLDYAWLLRESAARRARTLASMTKLDAVVGAQGLARRDIRRANEQITSAAAQLEDVTAALDEYEELPAEEKRHKKKMALLKEVEAGARRLAEADALLSSRDSLLRRARVTVPSQGEIDTLRTAVESNMEAAPLVEKRAAMYSYANKANDEWRDAEHEMRLATKELARLRALIDVCDVCGRAKECERCRRTN